jgi:hypothetical protein
MEFVSLIPEAICSYTSFYAFRLRVVCFVLLVCCDRTLMTYYYCCYYYYYYYCIIIIIIIPVRSC